jgi:F-type H+-transporting ATPase subunit b
LGGEISAALKINYGKRPMQIISNIALVSINETVIVQLISFLIFLFIINRVMFRPLRDTMLQRDRHVKQIQDDITTQESRLETLKNEISKKESSVKRAAFKMRKNIEDSGGQEAATILSATRKEIEALRKKSAQEVESKILDARKHLKKESESLVSDVIEKVLDRDRRPSP